MSFQTIPVFRVDPASPSTPDLRLHVVPENPVVNPPVVAHLHSPARRNLIIFIEFYLHIEFRGFQEGYGRTPDQILFLGPDRTTRTTLSIPIEVMLQDEAVAREAIQQKIRDRL